MIKYRVMYFDWVAKRPLSYGNDHSSYKEALDNSEKLIVEGVASWVEEVK